MVKVPPASGWSFVCAAAPPAIDRRPATAASVQRRRTEEESKGDIIEKRAGGFTRRTERHSGAPMVASLAGRAAEPALRLLSGVERRGKHGGWRERRQGEGRKRRRSSCVGRPPKSSSPKSRRCFAN